MSRDFLKERERALEEAFFRKREAELIARLRAEREHERELSELAESCGIKEPAVLDALLVLGIEPQTVAALALVPLVAVAWADGTCGVSERNALLEAASQAGIEKGHPGHELLDAWLAVKPPPLLFKTWLEFAREMRAQLDRDQREALRRDFVDRAREIAQVAGGILGLGPHISAEEREVFEQISDAI